MRVRLHDDRGMAVMAVMILGMALVLVTSVVVLRSVRQSGNAIGDATWEQTLNVAESGLDDGLARIYEDPTFTTGELLPDSFADGPAEKDWAVAAADARPVSDVVATPQGEYVVIRPSNTAAVYAVGFAPSRDDPQRRVRAVRAEIGTAQVAGGWSTRYAVLSGGSLEFNGNPTVLSGAIVGVHANGFLDVAGSTFVDGCLSSSGGSRIIGSVSQDPWCVPAGAQAPVAVPVVDPRSLWPYSMYDLCPLGKVRAGPAHPTMGHTAANVPCSGATIVSDASVTPFNGWRFQGCCDPKLGARWRNESNAGFPGVFYIYEGSVSIPSSAGIAGAPWRVTIIAEGIGSCTNIIGGDIAISGSPAMAPHESAMNLLLAAGRDIDISGGSPHLSGLIAAHEQVSVTGGADGIETSYLSEHACDSVDDFIDEAEFSGTATVLNSGAVASPFAGTEDIPVIAAWAEL
jgi:hypothetical protein